VSSDRNSPQKQVILAASLVALTVFVVCWFVWWTRPPQMGAAEEVFTAVDALFTAVRARDKQLLNRCERRLHVCKEAGTLPTPAAEYLDGIIQQAREGSWQPAAEKLYGFMRAQRREGEQDQPIRKKDKGHRDSRKK